MFEFLSLTPHDNHHDDDAGLTYYYPGSTHDDLLLLYTEGPSTAEILHIQNPSEFVRLTPEEYYPHLEHLPSTSEDGSTHEPLKRFFYSEGKQLVQEPVDIN